MRLTELLKKSLIKTELASTDKYGAFEELISLMMEQGLLPSRLEALDAVRAREEKMSTGIAPMIGIPHGKIPGIKNVVMALGISRKGIAYDAMDGQPVKVIFLVLSEEGNPGPHLQALAEISRVISEPDFTETLLKAKNADEILRLLSEQE